MTLLKTPIVLSSVSRLTDLSLSRAMADKVRRREAFVLLGQSGVSASIIAALMGCSVFTVYRWYARWEKTGDLKDRRRRGHPSRYNEDIHLKVIAFYCQCKPLPDCGRWTLRWAARFLEAHPEKTGIVPSKSTIHRILKSNKLKPHRSRYFLHITDPEFFPKMEHLVKLYMAPPPKFFFFDECPGIQVLKRLAPDMQTEEMKLRLEEFEYIRNGTMDVLAFLNYADGTIYAECSGQHTTEIFLAVFRRHASRFPRGEQIHYVMDNLSSHRSYAFCQTVAELSGIPCPSQKQLNTMDKRVQWLQYDNKPIVIHFTPFHGSWLNLVEIWFGIAGAKVFNESFGLPEKIKEAFDAFVEEWNHLLAHPFRWNYDGKGLHDLAVKRFTQMIGNSVEQMEVRFLTKELMLMANMLENYFTEVSEQTWNRFADVCTSQYAAITNLIDREEGQKRKKKAEQALSKLIALLDGHFKLKKAA